MSVQRSGRRGTPGLDDGQGHIVAVHGSSNLLEDCLGGTSTDVLAHLLCQERDDFKVGLRAHRPWTASQLLHIAADVRDRAVLLVSRGSRKHHVGPTCGFGKKEILHYYKCIRRTQPLTG